MTVKDVLKKYLGRFEIYNYTELAGYGYVYIISTYKDNIESHFPLVDFEDFLEATVCKIYTVGTYDEFSDKVDTTLQLYVKQ